jgi:hypothetical protein
MRDQGLSPHWICRFHTGGYAKFGCAVVGESLLDHLVGSGQDRRLKSNPESLSCS